MPTILRRKWFQRSFELGLDPSALPEIIERLRGTPMRLEERLAGVPTDLLVRRRGGAWSIQEHAGHLADLEPLWIGRLNDLAEGLPKLRDADLTNQVTWDADHNRRPLASVLGDFRIRRGRLVDIVESLTPENVVVAASHPRLLQPMTAVDLAFFVAEHDDHHLAWVTELRAAD